MLGNIPNITIKPLVILGAGASYDLICEDDAPGFTTSLKRPPLTDGIFGSNDFLQQIQSYYPNLNGLIGRIRKIIRVEKISLEEALDREYGNTLEIKKKEFEKLNLLLNNYLVHLFKEVSIQNRSYSGNNYSVFFEQLKNICPSYIVVNFNYDFLAQKALEELLNIEMQHIESYIDRPISLIQPHGSVLWSFDEEYRDAYGRFGNFNVHKISDTIASSSFNPQKSPKPGLGIETNLKIIAPLTSAKQFACPGQHISYLKNYLENDVNVVIIIGWKGREDHFKEQLKSIKELKRIVVVGGSVDSYEEKMEVLVNCGLDRFTNIPRLYISGFSNLLEQYRNFFSDYNEEDLF